MINNKKREPDSFLSYLKEGFQANDFQMEITELCYWIKIHVIYNLNSKLELIGVDKPKNTQKEKKKKSTELQKMKTSS